MSWTEKTGYEQPLKVCSAIPQSAIFPGFLCQTSGHPLPSFTLNKVASSLVQIFEQPKQIKRQCLKIYMAAQSQKPEKQNVQPGF